MTLAFDPTRVALVDQDTQRKSFLVRGMSPCTSGVFDYSALKEALLLRGVNPTSKRLIVVMVIDNVGERWAWGPEMRAFGVITQEFPTSEWPPYMLRPGWAPQIPVGHGRWESPSEGGVGDLYWWPFEGLPAKQDPKVFLSTPGWDFEGLVQHVSTVFQETSDAVIYFHCMLGADRTGALHTGYLMHAKGLSLAEASQVADTATSAGGPNADYQRLREAYAKTLNPSIAP